MRFKLTLSAAVLALSLSSVASAAEPLKSDMLANACMGCHGPAGVSTGAIPSIKGMPESYLIQVMQNFKSGKQPATIMDRVAKGYNDDEIAAMAKYFSNLK